MPDHGAGGPTQPGDHRAAPDAWRHPGDSSAAYQYAMMQNNYGCSSKDLNEQSVASYCHVVTGIYEASTSIQQYQAPRYNSQAPSFSSPPHSPLVGLVFDPSSSGYSGQGLMGDRGGHPERRHQTSWALSNPEPIGTGAKKKIMKSQDKRHAYSDPRYHRERDRELPGDLERQRRMLAADSTSSLDFFVEGERMVSELCNIPDPSTRMDHHQHKTNKDEDKNKAGSSDALLLALDKIVIHDQIPNLIVQLAIEACTDAENIAIAHHNRPCFKNIHSICAKTRSNVQKPDSAVANLHSQGIPWVIKNFIFSFVRILDGWKGVKELLSEKHDTFSRIENKYYSPNIRECFVQWQAVTKEMLSHIYKTFKCLDHGFTMEQKSFTHNYYANNSAAPRHQNQTKFQSKPARPPGASSQYNPVQPPWLQAQTASQPFHDSPWPMRSSAPSKKYPVAPSPSAHNFYSLNEQNDMSSYQKAPYKCDPCGAREAKPRQSWTISGDCREPSERELYAQLKHRVDAELGKQALLGSAPCDLMQRRDMELAKIIPLSHVEKSLIPSMAAAEARFSQKNNSCGDTKEETDFFAAWGQMIQKETSEYITHPSHNIQIPLNVVALSNNISGPVQFIDPENDEFHEMTKVYMKPGSYKVPIKPTDPLSSFLQGASQEVVYESPVEELAPQKMKVAFQAVTLAPQPKYNPDSWPCMVPRRSEDLFADDRLQRAPCLDMRSTDPLELLTAMTSDRAWEAAKQSAPKLMDFIHEGSKSDTARLYDALGLSTNDEFADDIKQIQLNLENNTGWLTDLPAEVPAQWDQQPVDQPEPVAPPPQDHSIFSEDHVKCLDTSIKSLESNDENPNSHPKSDESKENARRLNYDHTGSHVRDETQKKSNKTKVAASGMWYHPKKKKPLPSSTVKKFEAVISKLSQISEANFIRDDMDIKMAPRFYEVVKYPMCLHDISAKLRTAAYSDHDQVVHDFKRMFNNVKLYLKSYPDQVMKKSVNKVATEFEKLLAEEFRSKSDSKNNKHQDNGSENRENKERKKERNAESTVSENKADEAASKKSDHK
ncbi:uncharacterized protein LOC105383004 [Plutella xylostella]|uniref:uncharacterized protein LOC105383004 n=1 Tax=Plutella xylostella TaxID=51655 RepID=UPI0020329690|nr:uncharacterized protein LOC105383004 [Plutella xylostella]